MPSDSPAPLLEVVEGAPLLPVTPVVEPAAIVPEPVIPVVPVVEPPVAEPVTEPEQPFEAHTDTRSLISEVTKADETKPEVKVEAIEAVPEAPPVYADFALPEGVTVIPEKMAEYKALLGEYKIPQEAGQKLLERYTTEIQAFQAQQLQEQHRVFADTRREWVGQVRADPEMGGSGFNTTMTAVGRMIEQFVAPKNREAFNQAMDATGAGDHPEIVRFVYNVAKFFDEPAAPSVAYRPPPDIGQAPKASGRRIGLLYDKPMSNRGG